MFKDKRKRISDDRDSYLKYLKRKLTEFYPTNFTLECPQ